MSRLLCLPKELRYELYDLLFVLEPRSYPFGHSPIVSIDRRPPPVALLRSCRLLHDEIEDYFFGRVTLRFLPQAWSTQEKNNPAFTRAIRLAKRAEIIWAWTQHGMFYEPIDGLTVAFFKSEYLARTVELLRNEALNLETLVFTVQDCFCLGGEEDWSVKLRSLKSLEVMPARVRIMVGEATFCQEREDDDLKKDLNEYIEGLLR